MCQCTRGIAATCGVRRALAAAERPARPAPRAPHPLQHRSLILLPRSLAAAAAIPRDELAIANARLLNLAPIIS